MSPISKNAVRMSFYSGLQRACRRAVLLAPGRGRVRRGDPEDHGAEIRTDGRRYTHREAHLHRQGGQRRTGLSSGEMGTFPENNGKSLNVVCTEMSHKASHQRKLEVLKSEIISALCFAAAIRIVLHGEVQEKFSTKRT